MTDNAFIEKDDAAEALTPPKKREKKTRTKGSFLFSLINGEFLTKEFVLNNLTFIFYLIFMLLLLVAKGYYGKQLTKNVDLSQKELNDVLGDYVEKKALLEEKTRRIQLVEELAPHGLKETVNPTKVIRLRKNDE
jgi:hypothetical protein